MSLLKALLTPSPRLLCPACTQAESDVFASTGGDRSIALYDLRSARPIRKLVMQTRTNSVAWNPMEAFNFTAASEDCNLYTYDMRKLQSATCVHKVGTAALGSESNSMEVDHKSPVRRAQEACVAGACGSAVKWQPQLQQGMMQSAPPMTTMSGAVHIYTLQFLSGCVRVFCTACLVCAWLYACG
jgi:hypothetical protein